MNYGAEPNSHIADFDFTELETIGTRQSEIGNMNDLRYAIRMLRKNPGFTAVAVLSLALGIGANTAIFTLVDAILLRWLPVQNPQELVVLARNPSQPNTAFNYPDYCFVRDQNRSYAGLIAFWRGDRATSFSQPGGGDPSQLIKLSMVSGNYFQVLGVQPVIGRVFNEADNEREGTHPYAELCVLETDVRRRHRRGRS
jgi:putative ABC transport system permease protein